jgi:hypothetical protein
MGLEYAPLPIIIHINRSEYCLFIHMIASIKKLNTNAAPHGYSCIIPNSFFLAAIYNAGPNGGSPRWINLEVTPGNESSQYLDDSLLP